jgi:pimeloyl-ACP methyl ester carboxylesterase
VQEYRWRDGQTIAWEVLGSGPPLVMCHGTPWSSRLWRPIATALAGRHTVYLWDMPGYGRSTMAQDQDVSLAAQGEALVDMIAYWGLERPIVVAHDYGGAVSLRAHLLHGIAFRALALVDVVALTPWGSPFFRLVARNADVFAQLPANLHRALVREYISGAAHRELPVDALDALVEPWLGDTGHAGFYRQIAQADERYTREFDDLIEHLALPVLIVWGEDDTWIPVDRAHSLAARIPGAELHTVPDAGHLIQLDSPALLTGLLLDWLDRLPPLDR